MRALIKDLKPTSFEEIIPLIALYRPGPIEGGMVEDFVKRKHKQVAVKYELPELEPILRETHGVILYQEQVMEIASKIAGLHAGAGGCSQVRHGEEKREGDARAKREIHRRREEKRLLRE